MFVLPPALAAMQRYRQFIPYKLVPSATRPGKTDKFPIDYRTGDVVNAHNPAIWMEVDAAAAYADMMGANYGVGFVFTAGDPFFFIDIDNCADAGGWSPTAQALMQRFAGAAIEVSVSGTGLHIIGCGTAPSPRKKKYGAWFDLYTEDRFVALTGAQAGGEVWSDHTPALVQLVTDYLQPDTATTAVEWGDKYDAGWRGPEDDADLVQRAISSQSGMQAFGNRASFVQLWERDEVALTKFYPDDHGNRPFDESKADSALAQALAFWAGKNHERILRMMWQSKLVRQKWYDRPDYLRITISLVVARQVQVYAEKERQEIATTKPAEGTEVVATAVTGETFLTVPEQMHLFRGCVYVRDAHRALIPGGHLLKSEQFKVTYGGFTFPMDNSNEKVSRDAWEAFTQSQAYRSPRADGLTFRPECAPGAIIKEGTRLLANTWWPIEIEAVEGDASPFVNHVAKLLPEEGDRAILMAYMAAIVQYPGVKFQWAPFLQGMPGNGKTFLITAVANCLGERYYHLPNTEDLVAGGAKFTGWLAGKLFIGLEEIYTGDRRNMMDALKPLISNARVEIQAKGQDQVTGDNRANFFACSNEKDAIPKTQDERRWAIFFTAQQKFEDLKRDGMDERYMPDLYNWLFGRERFAKGVAGYKIVNHYLKNYPIPDSLNPATSLHRAPITSSTLEAIGLSIGAIEQAVLEVIEEGRPGFAGGWVSSMALDKFLLQIKAERRIPAQKRVKFMESLGYYLHPHLEGGRVHGPVKPDNAKTRLYAKYGHPINHLNAPAVIAKTYEDAQTQALTAMAKFG